MAEEEPLKDPEDIEPVKVPLRGPNVNSTFDTPPRPDAVKAHDAAIRRHLKSRRSERDPPSSGPAQGEQG